MTTVSHIVVGLDFILNGECGVVLRRFFQFGLERQEEHRHSDGLTAVLRDEFNDSSLLGLGLGLGQLGRGLENIGLRGQGLQRLVDC